MSKAYFRTFTTRSFEYQAFRLEDTDLIRVYFRMPGGDWEFGHKVYKPEGMTDKIACELVYLYLSGVLSHEAYKAQLTVA